MTKQELATHIYMLIMHFLAGGGIAAWYFILTKTGPFKEDM